MNFLNKLDLMYWHDGIFLGAQITLNADMSVTLFFELYKDTISKTREKIDIQFIDIENLIITTNTKELLENRGAGQINYAYIKPSQIKKKHRFIIYLLDGLISFDFSCGKMLNI